MQSDTNSQDETDSRSTAAESMDVSGEDTGSIMEFTQPTEVHPKI